MKGVLRAVLPGAAAALLLFSGTAAYALEADALVPVGSTVGIRLDMGGVMVAGLSQVKTSEGETCPAQEAGLKSGDVITRINGRETPDAAAFLTAVNELSGDTVELTAQRSGREVQFQVTPAQSEDGAYHIGLWLREGVSGIGTVTYYDPVSGTYGALGHGVNDLNTGELLPFQSGCLTASGVVDVIRGTAGTPGELCGQHETGAVLGTVERNTDGGIFGSGDFSAYGAPLPVAEESETRLGPATILANVDGCEIAPYSVEISRIYRGGEDRRFMLLTVTDEQLLARTGGIVQGMSGSPILQDGKLVGAVTHVLVNDPARGYGISIRDMLDAA